MLNQHIALMLSVLKWPTALASLLFAPATTLLLVNELQKFASESIYFLSFFLGCIGYLTFWYLWIRQSSISFLSTLEHEITHCIFAVLTFNRVTGLWSTLREGGRMTYIGSGNWLLTISPYFFPTVSVMLLISMHFMESAGGTTMYFLVGSSVAYHATSTWTETHHAQTDLQDAGFLFSVFFLPTANLLCLDLIIAVLRGGWNYIPDSLDNLLNSPVSPIRLLGIQYQVS